MAITAEWDTAAGWDPNVIRRAAGLPAKPANIGTEMTEPTASLDRKLEDLESRIARLERQQREAQATLAALVAYLGEALDSAGDLLRRSHRP